MRVFKKMHTNFKSIFFSEDILKENEEHANIVTASTMLNLFFIGLITWVLTYFDVFKIGLPTMNMVIIIAFILLVIVKVYKIPDCLDMIENERKLAKKAFVMGVPTATPYDIVKVGDLYGTVFELLNAKSIVDYIKKDENLDIFAKRSSEILKKERVYIVLIQLYMQLIFIMVDKINVNIYN